MGGVKVALDFKEVVENFQFVFHNSPSSIVTPDTEMNVQSNT